MSEFEVLLNTEGKVVNKVSVGIDTNNILFSSRNGSPNSYQAIQDCIICFQEGNSTDRPKIDNEYIGSETLNRTVFGIAVLKKGQTFYCNSGSLAMKVYGLKY